MMPLAGQSRRQVAPMKPLAPVINAFTVVCPSLVAWLDSTASRESAQLSSWRYCPPSRRYISIAPFREKSIWRGERGDRLELAASARATVRGQAQPRQTEPIQDFARRSEPGKRARYGKSRRDAAALRSRRRDVHAARIFFSSAVDRQPRRRYGRSCRYAGKVLG